MTPTLRKRTKDLFLKWAIALLVLYVDDLSLPHVDDEEKKWLAQTWENRGFQMFLQQRGKKHVRELSGGLGMQELKHDDYVRKHGQRFELLYLGYRARAAFEEMSRVRRAKRESTSTTK